MNESERKMLEEFALRNAIAKFRAASGKKASIPRVGIFWVDNAGTIFSESISLREAFDYDEFKVFDGSHYDLWNKAMRANPQWRGLEYEDIPRGRVVYKKDPKKPEFIVYLPKQALRHKNKVISEFDLPAGHVRFDTTDDHYRMESM